MPSIWVWLSWCPSSNVPMNSVKSNRAP
jgi:hypothetical protein